MKKKPLLMNHTFFPEKFSEKNFDFWLQHRKLNAKYVLDTAIDIIDMLAIIHSMRVIIHVVEQFLEEVVSLTHVVVFAVS